MIDNETVKEFIVNSGISLKEEAVNLIWDYIREKCKEAADEQRFNDIITSVIALSDAGIKEPDIYYLLSKFWNVDSRSEATEYINQGRHLEWPYSRLKTYLKDKGYDNQAMVKYMREYNVRKKLESNPKLCELSDEKLKSVIEK